MERFLRGRMLKRISGSLVFILICGIVITWAASLFAAHPVTDRMKEEISLLDGFRHVEAASVSDAEEKILGRRMYMSHRMRPIFASKFAGFALTVQLKKDEGTQDPNALAGMLSAIDQGAPDSVYVMALEDGVG